ncbi:PorP/SprF family type IX secretion system membrane protein [Pontibacter arcticus]|uniref:Type IX secretion system membrane protein, PorP/SprF family n=1 Tax=Pontibacter arcticus TaxID=2080288 RepID=A0A364RJS1_9BACT|nr:PorP/SprF family type IX secretion system membrane protein [Pontibacter arcticus]RAU84532.1 hypothetical protein DP923_04280 [Pontibacter arcticus]
MNIKKIYLIILCLFGCTYASAQDTYFTQQYANRLSLNPAFTGLNHDWSVATAYRNQWPSLNGAFVTKQVSADFRLPGEKSAIGAIVQQDKAGIGGLQKLEAAVMYGYSTPLTDKWAMSAGLQAGINSLRVNYDNLVFGDQLADNGQHSLTSAEVNNFTPSNYLTFKVGTLLYTNRFWAGLSAAHLNMPSTGFEQESRLSIHYTAIAGYKFYAKAYERRGKLFEVSFTPTLTYHHQQNFNRFDVGFSTNYTPVSLGIIYKGVPVTGDANQDQTLALMAGVQLSQFRIGFSHDVGLKGFSKQVGGATEISLVFEQLSLTKFFENNLGHKIKRNIFCPAF